MENGREPGKPIVRNPGVLIASAAGLAILLSLGTWQVFRLQEKNARIAAIEARIAAPPVPIENALALQEQKKGIEFLKVQAKGHYVPSQPLLKLTTIGGGAGFQVINHFITDSGAYFLVDRGVISDALRRSSAISISDAEKTITGILRLHDGGQGMFDGDNVPERNEWYWWDIPAMLAAANPPADAKIQSIVLQELPVPGASSPIVTPPPKAELRNNHLGYAITWYGLAAALVSVTWAFLRKRKQLEANTPSR